MVRTYGKDTIHGKLKYLTKLASEEGIELSMARWLELLKEIQLEISYEVTFRTLLDIYLILNLGFEDWTFDWPILPLDFDWTDITVPPCEETGKCYYGKGYYGKNFYDPPSITFTDLERFAWDSRYKISEKHCLEYKKQSQALKNLLEAREIGIEDAGVASHILPIIQNVLAVVESRILRGAYVGFAIVGLSRVGQKHPEGAKYKARTATRKTSDWKTIVDTESVIAWENIVGWSHVGFSRVSDWGMLINKQITDRIIEKINDFWLRSGLVSVGQLSRYGGIDYTTYGTPTYGGYEAQEVKTLYPRIFMLQRVDQYHYKGGAHRIKMQFNIERIRPILDRHGVMANFRGAYTSFANELLYRSHDGHSLTKKWKQIITDDDLLAKYKNIGCDESILTEIKGIVKP